MLVNNTYPPRPYHPSPVLPPPNSLQHSSSFHYGYINRGHGLCVCTVLTSPSFFTLLTQPFFPYSSTFRIYRPSVIASHSPSLSHSPPQPLSAYGSPSQTPSPVPHSYSSHMDPSVAVSAVGHHRSSSANVVPSPPTSCPSASISR